MEISILFVLKYTQQCSGVTSGLALRNYFLNVWGTRWDAVDLSLESATSILLSLLDHWSIFENVRYGRYFYFKQTSLEN